MKASQEQQLTNAQELRQTRYDQGFDLVDILNMLWRQRWFIVVLTLVIVALVTIYVMIKPPLYRITAQIVPGITVIDNNGNVIRNVSTDDIIAWFMEKAYADVFKRDIKKLPIINAHAIHRTDSVRITYFHKDPIEGKTILNKVLNALIEGETNVFNRELNVRKNIINQKIIEENQAIEMLMVDQSRIQFVDKLKIDNEINNAKINIKMIENKLDIIRKYKSDSNSTLNKSQDEIARVNRATEEVIALRKQLVLENSDKVVLLMYSNIIQQNISLSNSLQQQVVALKKEINDLTDQEDSYLKQIDSFNAQIRDFSIDRDKLLELRSEKIKIEIEQRKSVIEFLKMKLKNLATIEINFPPSSSAKPVKPDKIKYVVLSLFAGLMMAIFAVLLRRIRTQLKTRIEENSFSQ
jgi:LPS O-antigen subunit length determinant protein (WzzB/FepE family)